MNGVEYTGWSTLISPHDYSVCTAVGHTRAVTGIRNAYQCVLSVPELVR